MPALPDAFGAGIPAKADAIAKRPDANEALKLPAGCRHAGGRDIRVIEDGYRQREVQAVERRGDHLGQFGAFRLFQVGGFLNDAVANNARKSDADAGRSGAVFLTEIPNHGRDGFRDGFHGHAGNAGFFRIEAAAFDGGSLPGREGPDGRGNFMAPHQAHGDFTRSYNANHLV